MARDSAVAGTEAGAGSEQADWAGAGRWAAATAVRNCRGAVHRRRAVAAEAAWSRSANRRPTEIAGRKSSYRPSVARRAGCVSGIRLCLHNKGTGYLVAAMSPAVHCHEMVSWIVELIGNLHAQARRICIMNLESTLCPVACVQTAMSTAIAIARGKLSQLTLAARPDCKACCTPCCSIGLLWEFAT